MYIVAILPAILWGLIFIVLSPIKISANKQVFATGLGALVVSSFLIPKITGESFVIGIIGGLLWTIGFYYQAKSVKEFGVTITMPVSTGLQIIATTLFSVIVFNEWSTWSKITLGTLYILILIIGIFLVTYVDSSKNSSKKNIVNFKFATYMILSTLGFVIFVTIPKFFEVPALGTLFPQTIGVMIGTIFMNRKDLKGLVDKKIIYAASAGILWFLGNVFMFISIEKLGVTVAFAMTQLNVAVSTILAILVLKEQKTKKELKFVALGVLLIIFAGINIALI